MLRLFADEDLNGGITRALLRRGVDIQRVQDAGLRGASDAQILECAAQGGRVVVTHDRATLVGFAYTRIRASLPVAGVIAIPQSLSPWMAAAELELIALCSDAEEWKDRVAYLPLK